MITLAYDLIDKNNSPVPAGKYYYKDGSKKSYQNILKMRMKQLEVEDIDTLKAIIDITVEQEGFLFHGTPITDSDEHKLRRHNILSHGDTVTIKPDGNLNILCLDLDKVKNKYRYDNPKHIQYIVDELSKIDKALGTTDYIWQFSSSAGLGDPYATKAHIFYVMAECNFDEVRALTNKLNELAKDSILEIDGSTSRIHQPIFVSPPTFEDALQEPFNTNRIRVFKSTNKVLELPESYYITPPKKVYQNTKTSSLNIKTIMPYDLDKAKKAFDSEADSFKAMGKFIMALYQKEYDRDSVESAWERFYDGDNFTLVEGKHGYNKFNDCWIYCESIGIEQFDYYNISYEDLLVTTDSRFQDVTLIPNWSKVTLELLKDKIFKNRIKTGKVKTPMFVVSKKVDDKIFGIIKNNITQVFTKYMMERI